MLGGGGHPAQESVLKDGGRLPQRGALVRPLLQGESRRPLDGVPHQGGFHNLDLRLRGPAQLPVFPPAGPLLPGGEQGGEVDPQHPQAVEEEGPAQVGQGGPLRLHIQLLPQIQVQPLELGGAEFLQPQLLQLAVEVLLHAGAGYPLGEKADLFADLGVGRRQCQLGKLPVAHGGNGGVPQV